MSKTNASPHMGISSRVGARPVQDHSGKTCEGRLGRDVCAVGATLKPLTLEEINAAVNGGAA